VARQPPCLARSCTSSRYMPIATTTWHVICPIARLWARSLATPIREPKQTRDRITHGSFARLFNTANARPARRPSLVAVGEPAAEASELIRRQLGNSFGDFFDFHVAQYSTAEAWLSDRKGSARTCGIRGGPAPPNGVARVSRTQSLCAIYGGIGHES
jgi:hypothetical protein